jgi:chromosome partitioning protein
VLRNRLSSLYAHNKREVAEALERLAERLNFRLIEGLGERVIYRELFLSGLTLLDLKDRKNGQSLTLSHVAARQELRRLLDGLGLPRAQSAGDDCAAESTPSPLKAIL